MKKYASSILLLIAIAVFILGFTGCDQLLPDKLQANKHMKAANKLYTEEKYKLAIDEYEKALALNPELKSLYLYIGTSNSALYRPMKNDDRNKEYGDKAIDYLLKAKEAYPDKQEVIYALGDMYDKMSNFEESEKFYLLILEQNPDDPKSYYIAADFYSKYNKSEEAKAMYEKRITLDPKAPDGYLYFAGYGSDRRQWDLSIDNHEKRILALYDPDTLLTKLEVSQMKKDLEQVEGITKNMGTIRKHRSLDKAEKDRLIAEAQERLDKFLPEDELKTSIEEKEKQLVETVKNAWAKIETQTDELKAKIAEAYYTLGVVCWNKSYQTPPHLMGAAERIEAVEKGMDACNTTLKLQPDNDKAYAFIGLLWRQKLVAEPLKNDEYMGYWKKAYDKAKDLREKKLRRQRLQEQLEKMGQVE
ncbi:MAG: hypothetical protein GY950_28795 [bacterium]|nr:hypothetical protein [bacterium]